MTKFYQENSFWGKRKIPYFLTKRLTGSVFPVMFNPYALYAPQKFCLIAGPLSYPLIARSTFR